MLRFHELAPSPNSIKARLALRAKGLEFEAVAVDMRDRAAVVTLSGQELTPVIEDKGIVLNDSEAIIHYLDANYRGDAERLYGVLQPLLHRHPLGRGARVTLQQGEGEPTSRRV